MQCFGNLWVDICLGLIFLCYLLPMLMEYDPFQKIMTMTHLLLHGVLLLLMLVQKFPLEELLALLLGSALLSLGTAYLMERGKNK